MKCALCVSLFSVLALFISGCEKKVPVSAPGTQPAGYALLYSVASQEQDVDKLLWIKEPGKEIADWVKSIAAFNKVVSTQLEAWKQDGSVTNLTNPVLPPAELKARDEAGKETAGELIFDTNADLRVVMMLSQLQSLGYCADLCYAITEMPYGKDHTDTLLQWKKRYHEIENTGLLMLKAGTVNGQSTQPAQATNPAPAKKSNTDISHGPSLK